MKEKEIQIKICGMRDAQNISDVAALGVGYIGFIFYEKSPRFVGHDFRMINTPPEVKRVGVFVNENRDIILKKAAEHNLEFIQLHGHESPQLCLELQSRELKVIKVFSIDDLFDMTTINPYKDVVDYFLFDTKGKYFGGNSERFKWNQLATYDNEIPFFLSGGLTPENVGDVEGLTNLNIYAIDLNSGVEDRPGFKNIDKIRSVKQILNS